MSRKTINCIIACLLFLMPTLLCAQSLTTYEYWFDNDFNSRKTGSLSGSDAVVDIGIETGHLTNGIHRFSFRAKQSNGKYSAISSSLFLKRTVPQNSMLEYWVDGNIDQRESMSISNTEEEQSLELDLRNNTLYPFGFHKLYIRVAVEGEGESAIYSSPILKLSAGQASQLEYWIDDDLEHSKTLTGKAASDGDGYIYIDNLDLQDVPMGLHRLNCRAVSNSRRTVSAVTSSEFFKLSAGEATDLEYWIDDDIAHSKILNGNAASDGDGYIFVSELDLRDLSPGLHRLNCRAVSSSRRTCSAVVSSPILKLSAGKATQLEYWLDDDRENVHTIAGEAAYESSDYLFVNDLDLGAVTPGHHRLYCRAVSSSGKTTSAITMTPIIVKSKYNVSSEEVRANVKVTQYSLSVDNETPVITKFGLPDYDVTLDRDFDVHDLTPGTHTLKAKFYNSFGAGVGEESLFTMTVPESPSITLSATETNGTVQLNYDIPASVHRFALARRDDNGAKAVIYKNDENVAGNFTYTDAPTAGGYTYFVQGSYRDAQGESHLLNSNEVAVSVSQVLPTDNYGYIVGIIWPKYGASSIHDIIYSDGVKTTITDKYFERQQIPVGKELTISVKGNSIEEFETATITIKPGENIVSLKDVNNVSEVESKPNNFSNDLQFCSDLEWVGNNYQFSVKNVTRNKWSGYVRLRIITKDKALKEKENEEMDGENSIPSEEEDYDEITPGLRAEDNYVYVYSNEINNLQSGEATIVSLSLDNVFAPDKNDWYYIYFESVGKWNSDPKGSEKVKLIGIDYDYSITENPTLRKVNKKDLKLAEEKVLLQDAEYAANIILACCSKLNQLNGIIGNMGDIGWVELSKVYKEKYPIDLNNLNQYIDEAIETGSAADFKEDAMMQAFLFYVFGYNSLELANKFRENVANEIFKYSKGVDDYLGGALQCLKYIKNYRNWEQMNEYDRFFYCADAIIEAASRYNSTLGSVLNTYSKITKSFIQKALELDAAYYENYEVSLLKLNALSGNQKNHYNSNVDFKIMVRANYWLDFFGYEYFNFEENDTKPIREVVLRVHNSPTHDNEAIILFNLIPVSDGVMLKQTSIIDEDNMEDGKPIDRMCLEIKWKNGRITKIPLRADIDGVELGKNPHDHRVRQYTVYLRSGTTTFDNMADDIEVKK